jgi:hypothetical protein
MQRTLQCEVISTNTVRGFARKSRGSIATS